MAGSAVRVEMEEEVAAEETVHSVIRAGMKPHKVLFTRSNTQVVTGATAATVVTAAEGEREARAERVARVETAVPAAVPTAVGSISPADRFYSPAVPYPATRRPPATSAQGLLAEVAAAQTPGAGGDAGAGGVGGIGGREFNGGNAPAGDPGSDGNSGEPGEAGSVGSGGSPGSAGIAGDAVGDSIYPTNTQTGPIGSETTPPSVALNAANVSGAGADSATSYTFGLVFTDANLVDASSLPATIEVAPPTGSPIDATMVTGGTTPSGSMDALGDASLLTVTYQITLPQGGWSTLPAGTYTVTPGGSVTDLAGNSAATGPAGTFSVSRPPVVTSVSPAAGTLSGGTPVTISGAGFSDATAVDFGGTAAKITSDTATQITATSPPGAGTVDVTVVNGGGTSAIVPADQFTYLAAATLTWNGGATGNWTARIGPARPCRIPITRTGPLSVRPVL